MCSCRCTRRCALFTGGRCAGTRCCCARHEVADARAFSAGAGQSLKPAAVLHSGIDPGLGALTFALDPQAALLDPLRCLRALSLLRPFPLVRVPIVCVIVAPSFPLFVSSEVNQGRTLRRQTLGTRHTSALPTTPLIPHPYECADLRFTPSSGRETRLDPLLSRQPVPTWRRRPN
jgi:hypothetical protein